MDYKTFIPVAIIVILLGVAAYFLPAREKNAEQETSGIETLIESNMETTSVILKTSKGDISIELEGSRAPLTVGNFVKLAGEGFYNETSFHRVIPEFMVQGGDPLSKDQSQRASHGTGGPDYQFPDEINAESYGLHEKKISDMVPADQLAGLPEEVHAMTLKDFYEAQGYQYTTELQSLPMERGVIAMANSGPNTNGSQFFILVAPAPHLEGKHTPFGRVVSGMEVVDAIVNSERDENDNPVEPIIIQSIEVQQ